MIPVDFPRSLAILLLRFAIWIAPHDTLDWGRGMLSELNHVEGNWSALFGPSAAQASSRNTPCSR